MNVDSRVFFPIAAIMLICAGCPEKTNTKNSGKPIKEATTKPTEEPELPPPLPTEANTQGKSLWSLVGERELPEGERFVKPEKFPLYKVGHERLLGQLQGDVIDMELPFEREMIVFHLENSGTMSPGLAAKFPNIRSYKGGSMDGTKVRVDHNDDGLYVEYTAPTGKFYLSPVVKGNLEYYVFYPEGAVEPGPRGTR